MCQRIEALCTVSRDGFAAKAGEPLILRGWQRQLLYRLFARRPDGRRRHRTALIGLPRKNGKSALGSGIALDGLLFDGRGADVFSAAAEKEQAKIVWGETRRMIEAKPDLLDLCNPMRDVIEVPSTNSVYRALSAEAYSKEGLNPSRAIVDELHAHPTDELWNVLDMGTGGRLDPMLIAITTAGVMSDITGEDSICYRQYQYGKQVISGEVDDPSFFFAWWGAPDGADYRDPEVWRRANPGFGDLLDPEDFAAKVLRTAEAEFRTKRLNQWVASARAWLPQGAWEECEDAEKVIPDRSPVVLGFDGSQNQDTTAITVVSIADAPHVDVVGLWQRPHDARDDWAVPRGEVKEAIRAACRRWKVLEIAWDEFLWVDEAQELTGEGLPVVIFPQRMERMGPATQRFYEAVVTKGLTHSGNPALARHLSNATTKTDSRGTRIVKDHKGSPRKIDLAVAAVMALERAMQVETPKTVRIYSVAELLAQADEGGTPGNT